LTYEGPPSFYQKEEINKDSLSLTQYLPENVISNEAERQRNELGRTEFSNGTTEKLWYCYAMLLDYLRFAREIFVIPHRTVLFTAFFTLDFHFGTIRHGYCTWTSDTVLNKKYDSTFVGPHQKSDFLVVFPARVLHVLIPPFPPRLALATQASIWRGTTL